MQGREKAEYDVHPKADVIAVRALHNRESLYLIRLREDLDSQYSYHLKTLQDFADFDENIKRVFAQTPPENRVFQTLPIMPERSRFGLRGQLSKLGFGRFMDRQHEMVQNYVDVLLNQVPNTAADYYLQNFFVGVRTQEDQEMLRQMQFECRQEINMQTLKGHWRQGSHVWTVDATGKALFDGEPRGPKFDWHASGEGLSLVIERADGWQIDIEKTTPNHLYWNKPGNVDLEWIRVGHEPKSPGGRRRCSSQSTAQPFCQYH